MRIVVSDNSCVFDLRKASLLDAFLKLPYEIVIPDILFEDELLKFTDSEKQDLIRGGIKVIDLSGARVLRAQQLIRTSPQISIHDGFGLALVEDSKGCILLAGDGALRGLALNSGVEVQGVLWVIDEIYSKSLSTAAALHAALVQFENDGTTRFAARDLTASINRYDRLRV